MEVRAPAVVKLLGEHAVVHKRVAVAVAVELYAYASFESSKEGFEILLKDLGNRISLNKKALSLISENYLKRTGITSYFKDNEAIGKDLLPYVTIAATVCSKYNKVPSGVVSINSSIPKQSGLASSASCYVAFTVLLLKVLGVKVSDVEAIDIARDGERVSHLSEGAGRIDVSTSYYGGYVSFNKDGSFSKHEFSAKPKLLIINTGPKKPTSETVGRVAELLAEREKETNSILDEINECSIKGLEALSTNDMEKLGRLMFRDHELLKKLDVSSKNLDKAVGIAKKHNAYGAKLSGGGGGGIAIALVKDFDEKLILELDNAGFKCNKVHISEKGAKEFLTKD